ncbi:MAG TPA: alanine--tRNA ligase-related protein [Candidatus Saccharicenans sp.]|nr:alanine--tRNA ligase-related protein [Candidatus Saccharicenans sp.]HPC88184.1 alanine--tRNA ligase-related protein [Candidatus Saccharicenans sp.]HRV06242.1 alanine--tRNA ligase-related protein [Candidatus Saccharicenans sp.]
MAEEKSGYPPTEKLYFKNAYLKEFTARVIGQEVRDGQRLVVLDRTAFYPESGGQPHDIGFLNGVKVNRVEEEDSVIFHYVQSELSGEEVHGQIDWERRFDHMQQHTGQHILSQAFYQVVKGETLAFHLGQVESTVEIDIQSIKDETLFQVERLANDIIFSDVEIKTYFLSEDKIASVPLRKAPKVSGLIRIVEVSGFDYSACGGTHCERSGQVGLIKVIRQERIRGHVRFSFVCGFRALTEFKHRLDWLQAAARLFSSEEREVPAAAERTLAELRSLKKKQQRLEENLAIFEATEMLARSQSKIVSGLFSDKSPDELKFLALQLIHRAEVMAVLAGLAENSFYLVIAAAENLRTDVRQVVPVLQAEIKLKGGGSPTLVQLFSEEKDKAEAALKLAVDFLKKQSGLS